MPDSVSGIKALGMNIGRLIKSLSVLIPLAIAGNIVYILMTTRAETLSQLGHIRIPFLLLAVVLAFVPWITQAIALRLWSRLFRKNLSFRQSLKTILATDLGGAVVPTFLGGGYMKFGFLLNYGFGAGEATLIAFLGVMADGLFFAIALPAAVMISQAWTHPVISGAWHALTAHRETLIIIMLFIALGLGFYRLATIKGWLKITESDLGHRPVSPRGILYRAKYFWRELEQAAALVGRQGKLTFLGAAAVLGIGWSCRYGVISALSYGLGFQVDPVLFFLLQWLVFTATVLIPTPGGIGGAEVSFSLVYRGLLPSGIIPLITGVWRFITFYMVIGIGGLLLAILGGIGDRQEKPVMVHDEKETNN